jgi:streptomycin 6-kinase
LSEDPRIPDDLPVVVQQGARPVGRAWLPTLPGLLDAAVERWDLELGEPFRGGSAAWVAPVRVGSLGGSDAVLKNTLPHREARFEGEGLAAWDGAGAVRLLASEPSEYALLVERCRPGDALWSTSSSGEERARVGAELLRRLWSAPVPEGDGPFETVDDVAAEWAELTARRMDELRPRIDAGLVAVGVSLLSSLPAAASRRVLVHGDANPGNILRAQREPWLMIDAKPMVGDPCYDPWSLATQVDDWPDGPTDPPTLGARFATIAEVTGESFERMLGWSCARSVESALWHASLAEPGGVEASMRWARVFADLGGL